MVTILDGTQLSQNIRVKLKEKCNLLKEHGINPKLVIIWVGDDPSSKVYIKNKLKASQEIGIDSEVININSKEMKSSQLFLELSRLIYKLNSDENVDGILIQKPIQGLNQSDEKALLRLIDYDKDVDGFTLINEGKLYENDCRDALLPCTAKGIITLLKENDIRIKGKHIVILGRSLLVGKPLALLLLNNDATITVCHSKTENLKEITKQADILISAIGNPNMITKDYIGSNTKYIIDVGTKYNEKGILCGDIDRESIESLEQEIYVTPIKGGVGPMTVASLMENVIQATMKRRKFKDF